MLVVAILSLNACGQISTVSPSEQETIVEKPIPIFNDISIGSTIQFGAYEQDNNYSNGKEPIDWMVLTIEDNKALLISKYALDCQPFSTNNGIVWDSSSLRRWLNSSFLNEAFTIEEQAIILTTEVTVDRGNNTTDMIFIQSAEEQDKYNMGYVGVGRVGWCQATAYARSVCPLRDDGDNTYSCWTRSTLLQADGVVRVIISEGCCADANADFECVRPMMWIDIG